jgi:tRNA(Arg) A34 adenosine deaminase TadA
MTDRNRPDPHRPAADRLHPDQSDPVHSRDPESDQDKELLRRVIDAARRHARGGGAPYSALIASASGEIICQANNWVRETGVSTRHAEIEAIEAAQRQLGRRDLGGLMLVSSTEPCPMCAGATHWSGITRLVFGLSIQRLRAHGGHAQLDLSCRSVLGGGNIEIVGPLLEDEALTPHQVTGP